MKAILQAPVDLLFNGGIGTYVKAASESHADVGDKANDNIRVNGAQVRARMVGEGGNLGLTQRGRIEYAGTGGHIGTDFIDNTAGVDTSDHEVNMKILLGAAEADGELTRAERDDLLASMTDEVAALVLRDDYEQNVTLGNARVQASALLSVHRRMITEMERSGHLDRALEALPSDEEMDARTAAGVGLTSPEMAVLMAYTKILAERDIAESSLPDDEWTTQVLAEYFPNPLRERFRDRMRGHRLRREIVTTSVVNEAVNRGGISFVFRAIEETGASQADVVRAFVVVRDVYGLGELWRRIEELDTQVPMPVQTTVHLELRRLVDRAVRRLVHEPALAAGRDRRGRGVAARGPGPAAQTRRPVPGARARRRARAHRRTGGHGRAPRRGPGRRPTSPTASDCSTSSRWRPSHDAASTRWPASTTSCPSGSASTNCCRGSRPCRATTGGPAWPAWHCGTTSTPPWPR